MARRSLAVCLLMFAVFARAEYAKHWFPGEHLYPFYLADPYQLNFYMQPRHYTETGIPDSGKSRWDLMVGAPLIIYEQHAETPGHGWQLVFLGGLRGQFDNNYNQDNIAWEGLYGLQAVFRYRDDLAFRIGGKHYSSHLGDEYIERTGAIRIHYTREEIRAGVAWTFNDYSTLYSDIGYGYDIRNESILDPWRVQIGLQYQRPGVFLDGNAGWYTALDISSYEENDWDKNYSFQLGFDMPTEYRRWRLGLAYYNGRSQYGEFFQYREKYYTIGLWVDL
jgi:opacity protein-like surface antigen